MIRYTKRIRERWCWLLEDSRAMPKNTAFSQH